jgi:streptomycin 3"-adenylyltransferase
LAGTVGFYPDIGRPAGKHDGRVYATSDMATDPLVQRRIHSTFIWSAMHRNDKPMGRIGGDIDRILGVVVDTLGSHIVGAYLFGSAVIGELRPDSDLDLLVLTREPISPEARRHLVAALLRVSGKRAAHGPARNAEVTVVVFDDLVPWRHSPRSDFVFGEWLRDDFEAGVVPSPTVDADLTLVLATALQGSAALMGPPLAQYLPSVPADDVRVAIADSLPALVTGLAGDERNVMLTLARMWVTLATGEIVPKNVAATRMLARLPEAHRAVLALARDAYLGTASDAVHGGWASRRREVGAFVHYALGCIERLLAVPQSSGS